LIGVVIQTAIVKTLLVYVERHFMDQRFLDYESVAMRRISGRFELVLLIFLTVAPLLGIFDVVGTPFETPAGTVLWCVWVGMGSVLPWRYVRRGEHPTWAGVLGTICTLLLLWVLVLEAGWFMQQLRAP
jgi:hypothetical protein